MDVRTGFVDLEEGGLYYEVAWAGSTIEFLSAQSLDTRMWDDQFSFFARDCRVVRCDPRGQGRSTAPLDRAFSHYDDLRRLLDQLDVDRARLVGSSLSGGIILNAGYLFPERVGSIIASGPFLNGYAWPYMSGLLRRLVDVGKASRY